MTKNKQNSSMIQMINRIIILSLFFVHIRDRMLDFLLNFLINNGTLEKNWRNYRQKLLIAYWDSELPHPAPGFWPG